MNLSSSMLWHKRLGHISKQRLERLVRDGVFSNLDFLDFETCVVCLKVKMTAKTKNEKIDRGYKYFITFIDDFSIYGYVELIHEKSDSLNVFKAFKAKVELQLGKPIKVVKSDTSGEYYGRYDETRRNPGPFASFCWNAALMLRYTIPSTPQQNGVVERRNRTLLDMVSASKSVPKTPYELCGQGKNQAFTISMFGIFYYPSHPTKIIESDRVVYFEDEVNVDPNFVPREIPFGDEHVIIHFLTSHVPNVDVPIVPQPSTNQGKHGDQVEPDIPVDDSVVDGIPLRKS
ncbi:Retrovirus-related Pol polyprotein from transposon TNT 1-94 [Vitis vinifera]|uniref:Retrovirus-related Pol polyprotein from transposon TNT 1-94 n=1 Tax=Vitis vinifera TaxID=29760 RepID=A0A438DXI8_VITVI|nr:Retrovirus-related Pol polyprotein from transposon TNT 1-94 [Vitis vinifera]